MSNYTTYKSLEKPLSTEKYDIAITNKNADIIDSELNKLEQKAQTQESALEAEIERATNADLNLKNDLTQEIQRANGAENRLTTNLSAVSTSVDAMDSRMTTLTDRIDNLNAADVGALSLSGGVIGKPDDIHLHINANGITGDTNTTIKDILKIDTSDIDAKCIRTVNGEIDNLTVDNLTTDNLTADVVYIGNETVPEMVQRMITASGSSGDVFDSNGNLNMNGHNILGANKIFAQKENGFEMDFDSLSDFDMGWRNGINNPNAVDFPIGLHLSTGGTAELRTGHSVLKMTDSTWELQNQSHKSSIRSSGNTLNISCAGADSGGDIEIEAANDIDIQSENFRVNGSNHFSGKKFEVSSSDGIEMTAANTFDVNGSDVKMTSGNTMNLYSDKSMHIHNRGGKLYMAAQSEIYLIPGKTESSDWEGTPQKYPNRVKVLGDLQGIGTPDLGSNSMKWDNVYAMNGVIQTSDRNEKNTIEPLHTEKAKDFIMGLKPVTYKMNGGTSDRTHWGLIAQDVEVLLADKGIDSKDFAGFIKSPKALEGEYDYSLRYDEFIAPMINVIQNLNRRVEELEKSAQKN